MSKEINKQINRAAVLVSRGKFCAALLRLAGTEFDDHGMAWQLRGICHFALEDYSHAMLALERATMLVPLCAQAQCHLAESYLRNRKRELALMIYQHLAESEQLAQAEVEAVAAGLCKLGEHSAALQFCLEQMSRYRTSHRLVASTADAMRHLDCEDDEILPLAFLAHCLMPENLLCRVAFAGHLLSANRSEEAFEVMSEVDVDEVSCIPSLESAKRLFCAMGDWRNEEACQLRLLQIGYELSSSFRPPRGS